jgi:hypothetical protein
MNTSLINETNTKLNDIIEHLKGIKDEYESKLATNKTQIDDELAKVDEYKSLFYEAKKKIQKMSDDINGFEEDYRNLVEKFQNDELQNILVSANKEITLKIDERKKKIKDEQIAMNKLVQKASFSKQKLVKLTAEKKAIQLKLDYILDAYEFYNKTLSDIIEYSTSHSDDLCSYFGESKAKNEIKIEPAKEIVTEEVKKDDKKNKKDKNKEPKKIEIVEVEEKEEPIVEEEVQFDENTDAEDFFNFDDSIPD